MPEPVVTDSDGVTPEGDPIEVRTLWLDFGDEGEIALSLDLTRFNAARPAQRP